MKIPLEFVDNRVVAATLIYSHKLRLGRQSICFIIDTGCPESFISYGDILRLNVPQNALKIRKDPIVIANTNFNNCETGELRIIFENEEGKPQGFDMKNFHAATPIKKTKEEI